jgi:hypothetical protein
MSLKAIEINGFRPGDAPYKKTDEKGLFLLVKPTGSKLWYWKYLFGGREKKMAIGPWPDVSLAKARHIRDINRIKLAEGTDPMMERKRAKNAAKYGGAVKFALRITPHVFVRPGELRHAEWSEFDLAKATWPLHCSATASARP